MPQDPSQRQALGQQRGRHNLQHHHVQNHNSYFVKTNSLTYYPWSLTPQSAGSTLLIHLFHLNVLIVVLKRGMRFLAKNYFLKPSFQSCVIQSRGSQFEGIFLKKMTREVFWVF
jgi:hypothetical protein